jgi:hypothetical protein|nr:MAG TPA: Endolysin [Caudoviricetes sp.]
MSICNGVAGNRGRNPIGIFIHNDAGSQNANAAFYRNWLQTHPLENGFAHYYVAQDDILQSEDDSNCAWHCGNLDGNLNYLSVEVCQSMGDLDVFKHNEEKAFQLVASKCIQYGITPNDNTIRLHQEVYATSCPHRSVEIHGGMKSTKAYFIERIKAHVKQQTAKPSEPPKLKTPLWYQAHVSGKGWMDAVNGGTAGTVGQNRALEAIKIDMRKLDFKIKARAHIQNIGLKDFGYIKHDTVIGTTGKGLHLEAIELIAEGLKGKKLQARVHIQDIGWTRWTSGMIGTVGMNKKIEAIELRLV